MTDDDEAREPSYATGAAAATGNGRVKAPGGIRLGNLYFSSGLTGVRSEARKVFISSNARSPLGPRPRELRRR